MSEVEDLQRRLEEREREIAILRRRLDGRDDALARIIEITASLNSTLELETLLDLVMSSAAELLEAESSSLLLVDEETGELVFKVLARDDEEHLSGRRLAPGEGIAGWVVENGKPVVLGDPGADPRFYAGIDEATGRRTRSLLAVPLDVRRRVIGVVEVTNKRGDDAGFTEQDVVLAVALAHQAAIAIDNARLYARLADAVVTARISYRF
jgi:sigma-B regulation protein RsbU (phosphoserine phosphatase)